MTAGTLRLYTVEFYGETDPEELLGVADVPAARAVECARKMGELLCRIRKRNAVNAVLLSERGDLLERMIVYRR